jgi:hypothetical protein
MFPGCVGMAWHGTFAAVGTGLAGFLGFGSCIVPNGLIPNCFACTDTPWIFICFFSFLGFAEYLCTSVRSVRSEKHHIGGLQVTTCSLLDRGPDDAFE